MYRRTGAPPCFVARQNSNFLTKMKRTLHLHKTTSTSIASSSRAIRILVSSRTNYTVLQRMENCRFTTVPLSSSFSSFPLSLSLSLSFSFLPPFPLFSFPLIVSTVRRLDIVVIISRRLLIDRVGLTRRRKRLREWIGI